GMSQVSEMILATVSKVEGISKSLIGHAFRATAADVFAIAESPRSGPSPPRDVGCPYSEEAAQVQWRRPAAKVSTVEGIRGRFRVIRAAAHGIIRSWRGPKRGMERPRHPVNQGRFVHAHSICFCRRPRRDLHAAIVVERAGYHAPGRRGAH